MPRSSLVGEAVGLLDIKHHLSYLPQSQIMYVFSHLSSTCGTSPCRKFGLWKIRFSRLKPPLSIAPCWNRGTHVARYERGNLAAKCTLSESQFHSTFMVSQVRIQRGQLEIHLVAYRDTRLRLRC
jgi:hypothetical protein